MHETAVRDQEGDRYTLTIDDEDNGFYYLYLTQGGRRVGHAKCVIWNSSILDIADIRIYEAVARSKPCLLWFVPWRVWKKLTGQCYREKGLGSVLLQQVKDYARCRGLKQVQGSVMCKDLAATPRLLDWYAKRGFRVIPNEDSRRPSVAAWIVLEL